MPYKWFPLESDRAQYHRVWRPPAATAHLAIRGLFRVSHRPAMLGSHRIRRAEIVAGFCLGPRHPAESLCCGRWASLNSGRYVAWDTQRVGGGGGRERERERERERQRERERETDRQTHRERARARETEGERQRERARESQTDRQTDRHRERARARESQRETETERETDRQNQASWHYCFILPSFLLSFLPSFILWQSSYNMQG